VPTALIDDFGDETLWQALTPANAPSAEIALALDAPSPALPAGGSSMRAAFSPAAADHRIERGFGPVDLSSFSELRFWVRASQPATGSPTAPFRLAMRLGSAALPIGVAGNIWLRYLPVPQSGRWILIRVALDDLAATVRAAADSIEFRAVPVLAGTGGVTIGFDDLRAAAPRMAEDAAAALVTALDGGLQLGGAPVPAVIEALGVGAAAPPFIRIVNYDAAFAERRGSQQRRHADYTDAGNRIWPEPEPWDLFYRINFATADATEQAAMLDFTVGVLGGRSILDIGGLGHVLERVPNVLPDDASAASPLLRYRLAAWLERGAPFAVVPVSEVQVAADIPA
jgi:hypothetical protein